VDTGRGQRRGRSGEDAAEARPITIGERDFNRRGGLLCLDFVNTVETWHPRRGGDAPAFAIDYLDGYGDLLAWARQVGVVTERSARALAATAARGPEEAAAVFRRAVALRTAIHDLAVAVAEDRPVPIPELAVLNAEIGALLAVSRLEPAGEAFVLARPGERDEHAPAPSLDTVLWPVLRSAIALFTSADDLARVRACPADDCGWLFYDATGRRRWCSMASCGTLHKVRRFRARQRDTATA
jgi:predicted RNA-binding Zn ribbon-like protein